MCAYGKHRLMRTYYIIGAKIRQKNELTKKKPIYFIKNILCCKRLRSFLRKKMKNI